MYIPLKPLLKVQKKKTYTGINIYLLLPVRCAIATKNLNEMHLQQLGCSALIPLPPGYRTVLTLYRHCLLSGFIKAVEQLKFGRRAERPNATCFTN